jgi:hypothetical protein
MMKRVKKPPATSLYKPAHQAMFAEELKKAKGISAVVAPVSPLTIEQQIQQAITDLTMPSIPLYEFPTKSTPIRTLTTPPRSTPQLTVSALNAINATKTPPTPTFTSSPHHFPPLHSSTPTKSTLFKNTPSKSTPTKNIPTKNTPFVSPEGVEPSVAPMAEEKNLESSRANTNFTREVEPHLRNALQNFPNENTRTPDNEKNYSPTTTIVWADDKFFRLPHPLPFSLPLPLTPLHFCTSWWGKILV